MHRHAENKKKAIKNFDNIKNNNKKTLQKYENS
jgi:hypothetical protein